MNVVDANYLIALFDPADAHHAWATQLLETFGAQPVAITSLDLAEVLVRPYQQGLGAEFEEALVELEIEVLGAIAEDATELAKLRGQTGLRMPDVVALQTALRMRASLATADARLARQALALGISVHSPA
jgi:predicted nucleic acid-binding protein